MHFSDKSVFGPRTIPGSSKSRQQSSPRSSVGNIALSAFPLFSCSADWENICQSQTTLFTLPPVKRAPVFNLKFATQTCKSDSRGTATCSVLLTSLTYGDTVLHLWEETGDPAEPDILGKHCQGTVSERSAKRGMESGDHHRSLSEKWSGLHHSTCCH